MDNPKRILFGVFLVSTVALSGCAGDGHSKSSEERLSNFEAEKVSIPEYRDFLEELASSISQGVPREFNGRELARYRELDQRLQDILADYDSIEQMNREERRRLFNTHEKLEMLISGQRENQVICSRRHTVGTNFRVTECHTRAEWERQREASQEFMRDRMRQPAQQLPSGPGG